MALPILNYIPFSTSLAVAYLLNAILAFAAVVLVDKIISHDIEAKHALILSAVSFFAVPLIAPFVGAFDRGASIILSFVSWVILGEIILQSDRTTKLKVLVIAFAVYYLLSIFVTDSIYAALSRYISF